MQSEGSGFMRVMPFVVRWAFLLFWGRSLAGELGDWRSSEDWM